MSSVALEMKHSIVSLAGPRALHDTRESMIARAARKAGITFRQAKALFYGETLDPRFSVVDRVRRAAEREAKIRAEEAAARDEYQQLIARIAACEAALLVQDEEFHRPSLDGLREVARGTDRSVDQAEGRGSEGARASVAPEGEG